jgi:hypothetical protein
MNYIDEVQTELAKHIKVGKGLMDYYSLLVLLLGEETTLADVHDAWAVNINRTWKKDNPDLGDHRSVIPFNDLSPEVQAKDQKFVDAIHATTKALRERGVKW